MLPSLFEAKRARVDADRAMEEFRLECGLNETSNVKQCLRVLLQRLSASTEVQGFSLIEENGVSDSYWFYAYLVYHRDSDNFIKAVSRRGRLQGLSPPP